MLEKPEDDQGDSADEGENDKITLQRDGVKAKANTQPKAASA